MGVIQVSGELKQGFTVVNETRGHRWISDEPKDVDGFDLGPKPTELLLSSLVSCKLITLQMYAARKGWNVDGVKIHLEIIGKEEKTIVAKRIDFATELSEDQKKRLIEISGRCPVVKMLSDSIEFKLI